MELETYTNTTPDVNGDTIIFSKKIEIKFIRNRNHVMTLARELNIMMNGKHMFLCGDLKKRDISSNSKPAIIFVPKFKTNFSLKGSRTYQIERDNKYLSYYIYFKTSFDHYGNLLIWAETEHKRTGDKIYVSDKQVFLTPVDQMFIRHIRNQHWK